MLFESRFSKKEINENIMKIPSVSGDNLNIFLSEELLKYLKIQKII